MLNVALLREVQTMISNPDTVFQMHNWGLCIAGCTYQLALKNGMQVPEELLLNARTRPQFDDEFGFKRRVIEAVATWALGLDCGQQLHLFHLSGWPIPICLIPSVMTLRQLACRNIDALIADPASFALGLPPRLSPDPMEGLVRADRIIAASNLAKMIGEDVPTTEDVAELVCA